MKKLTILDRLLFLVTIVLASYLIVTGFATFNKIETALFTLAMGVFVIASLLLLLLGFDILANKAVVIVATITPLSLSAALVLAYLPQFSMLYSVFAILGFLAIVYTRFAAEPKFAAMVLAPVHGIAGLIIFFIPLIVSLSGHTPRRFVFVGIGGALFGIGGLLLAFLKSGKPLLSAEMIFKILPLLLAVTTACFVLGF